MMKMEEIQCIISTGEDSRHKFRASIMRSESLAQEMVAMSNSFGGKILVGVSDDGRITGLSSADIKHLDQSVSRAAVKQVNPSIHPTMQEIPFPDGVVMVVSVPEGDNKPYMDWNSDFYVKCGVYNRKIDSREEILRMIHGPSLKSAESILVNGSTIADIDLDFFHEFFEKEYGERIEEQDLTLAELLENMNLTKAGKMKICGTLLFSSQPQTRLPNFHVKAVVCSGTQINDFNHIESQTVTGKFSDILDKVVRFLYSRFRGIQNKQNVNLKDQPAIPKIVFEELIVNSLIHRDYFIDAPVKVLVFSDRVEVINPGCLPYNLTVENFKFGISYFRNPTLVSFAAKILPSIGFGGGVRRAIMAYPNIEFLNDREGNTFQAIIRRI